MYYRSARLRGIGFHTFYFQVVYVFSDNGRASGGVYLYVVELNIFGFFNGETAFAGNIYIAEGNIFNWHFDQAIQVTGLVYLGGNIAEMNITKAGRPFRNRFGLGLGVL